MMKMLHFAILLLFLTNLGQSRAFNQCKGNKQNIVVPPSYDKGVPNASQTGNATEVSVAYGIKHLRKVSEER